MFRKQSWEAVDGKGDHISQFVTRIVRKETQRDVWERFPEKDYPFDRKLGGTKKPKGMCGSGSVKNTTLLIGNREAQGVAKIIKK